MSNIEKTIRSYDIELDSSQTELFEKFLKLFLEKNSHINLSAIRDEDGIIHKHFIDSIMLNKEFRLTGKVLDIGTGGGFPGIPLSITNPDTDFTLLDSTRKKIDAVNGFITELGLGNVRGVWGRAEEFAANPEYKKKFDFIVSRATAYLPQIIEWSLPFLKKGGMMIFYKSGNPEEIDDGVEYARNSRRISGFETKEYLIQDQKRMFIFVSAN